MHQVSPRPRVRRRSTTGRLTLSILTLCAVLATAAGCTGQHDRTSGSGHANHGGAGPDTTASAAASAPSCDTRFVAEMIPHHEQAVEISELALDRASDRQVVRLAEAIIRKQRVEIAFMQDWVESDDATTGGGHMSEGMHGDHAAAMPGMLTRTQIAALSSASGASFDELFLHDMIRHHRGALTMIDQMLGTVGSTAVRGLATDTAIDQRYELIAMRRLQIELDEGRRPSQPEMAQLAATQSFDDPLPSQADVCDAPAGAS